MQILYIMHKHMDLNMEYAFHMHYFVGCIADIYPTFMNFMTFMNSSHHPNTSKTFLYCTMLWQFMPI